MHVHSQLLLSGQGYDHKPCTTVILEQKMSLACFYGSVATYTSIISDYLNYSLHKINSNHSYHLNKHGNTEAAETVEVGTAKVE